MTHALVSKVDDSKKKPCKRRPRNFQPREIDIVLRGISKFAEKSEIMREPTADTIRKNKFMAETKCSLREKQ